MNAAAKSRTATARFPLGQLFYTPGAQEVLQEYQVNPFDLLNRHMRGDWGDVCAEDAQANDEALQIGTRLLSAYVLPPPEGSNLSANAKIWIITEADRSVTTLLLPSEY